MTESRFILLADDEYFLRLRGQKLLQEAGYRVLMAADGRECLRLYDEVGPECVALVVLDYLMPEMDGITAFRAIRQRNPKAHVLLHSASLEPERLAELLKEGLLGAIPKPVSPERFLELVREAL